jgi:ParB family chromosome partitioning protein
VRDVPDQAALAIALVENIQREDLSPLEEANALQRLAEEFGLTHQEVAEAVGRSRVAVTNLLRLLELPAEIKALLQERQIEMGHARALLGLPQASQRIEAARRVVSRGLSVRETEALVRRLQGTPAPADREPQRDPDVARLQDDLSQRLGAAVRLQQTHKGKGKLIIHYNSLEELDGILLHIR